MAIGCMWSVRGLGRDDPARFPLDRCAARVCRENKSAPILTWDRSASRSELLDATCGRPERHVSGDTWDTRRCNTSWRCGRTSWTVSYTHLTLPTSDLV